ncbi:hypothetical protein [Paenibacillus oryzisoli]|uniref:ATP-binding protein n=1 Tax=Paenibacillus oryzisoli TaxID=1850517 RepID=A0A198AB79_9BACL|nr:hypothetical protein [Paenibacillus oryzisoli]OAS18422.1 hypothetical protein A8708_00360 [Paenibacillus oryzisoli]
MSKELIIFKANTDAVGTNRGFVFQYLKTLVQWLTNYRENIGNLIYCEVEDDIKQVNKSRTNIKWTQVKCYSSAFNLGSDDIHKTLYNFFVLFASHDVSESYFSFESNSKPSGKDELFNEWINKQPVTEKDLELLAKLVVYLQKTLSANIEEVSASLLKNITNKIATIESKKSSAAKMQGKKVIDELKIEYQSIVSLSRVLNLKLSDNELMSDFIKRIDWVFDYINPNASITKLKSDAMKLLSEIIPKHASVDLYFYRLLSEIFLKSTETEINERSLDTDLMEEILNETEEHLKEHTNQELVLKIDELESTIAKGFSGVNVQLGIIEQKLDVFNDKNVLKKHKYSSQWFRGRVEENIRNIGNRYSENLNVELQISELIDAIELNDKFKKSVIDKCEELIRDNLFYNHADNEITNILKKLQQIMGQISSNNRINKCLCEVEEVVISLKRYIDESNVHRRSSYFLEKIQEMYTYLQDTSFQAALNPFVVVTGSAGVGKSHFMTNHALRRLNTNKISIFLLGQLVNFEDSFLQQIKKQLDIPIDEDMDDFFEVFNEYGIEQNERVIIFIDALNEATSKKILQSSISGFVERMKRYSNIALVMSVRDTYEKEVIPADFFEINDVMRVEFDGFDNIEHAVREFFNYYKVPLTLNDCLKYQFKNPLFLKVYCISYDKHNSADSIEGIFNNYFRTINNNLRLRIEGYPKHGDLVNLALSCFIDTKLKYNNSYLLYEVASREVNNQMAFLKLNVNFFDELVNEQVITVNTIKRNSKTDDIVYITFELFSEFIVAKRIIEANEINKYNTNLKNFFSEMNPYYHLLMDDYSNQGIFEAIAVQLPEIAAPELEMYYWPRDILRYDSVNLEKAYYNSLKWRRPEAITGISHSFILNEVLVLSFSSPRKLYKFWDEVLKFSIDKKHYYNANFLYESLMNMQLDDFNALWTVYVSEDFKKNDCFTQIMKWAWKDHTESLGFDEEALYLLGMNITWFMASTDDQVRDVSIKSLVKLFKNHIHILLHLIRKFRFVKDIYIIEGLFCATYGCVLNSNCLDEVEKLADYVFKEFFDVNEVIHSAMIRSYLVGIIEYALSNGRCKSIDMRYIKPPYTNRYTYYEVNQSDISKLRKDSMSDDLMLLDPYYAFRNRVEIDIHYMCQNKIISNLEACYTNISVNKEDYIHFELSNTIDYILPEYRVNFVRMVIKEIFDMGYNYIKFGEFDLSVKDVGDHTQSLGQKYEWIALNKILSIYLDHNPYIIDRYNEDITIKFEGVWQFIFHRKIDPSIDYFSPYDTRIVGDDRLLTSHELLDNFNSLIEIKLNDIDWIAVNHILYKMNDNKYSSTDPYLLKMTELEEMRSFLNQEINLNFHPIEDLYVKEIYWSQAYRNLLEKQRGKDSSHPFLKEKMIVMYVWDINDGAMRNYIEFSILSPETIQGLQLSMGNTVFEFNNVENELVCLNLYEDQYDDLLLIRKDFISNYLKRSQKVIVWPLNNQETDSRMIVFNGYNLFLY